MMPRIFWQEPVVTGASILVAGDDGHHFARVLRAKPGEQATVAANGTGYLAVVRAVDTTKGTVELELTEQLEAHDARHQVYLLQALAKADKIESIVQKCTEVGIAGILVYESSRSVVKLNNLKRTARVERWNKVAREAAIQCQRDTIPLVSHAASLPPVQMWLEDRGKCELLLLDEAERAQGLGPWLRSHVSVGTAPTVTVLVVGPEGGWSDDEREFWVQQGAVSISLGPRILRTETAGVVATAAVLYEYGDLGG